MGEFYSCGARRKTGEFYGEEKLIWAASWGDGVGRKKKERTDDVEVFWERKMLKRGQRVGGMICNLCRSAEEGGVGIARRGCSVTSL